jgi:hypothetical protein
MSSSKLVVQGAAGALGGGDVVNVEDVYGSAVYTGNGTTQAVFTGVDLGGPVDNVELHLQGDDNDASTMDVSPRGRTLTKNGTLNTTTSTKKFTSALDFTDSPYLNAGAPLLNSGAPFCVETWVNFDDTKTSGNMSMICSQYVSSASGRMLFGAQSGNLVVRVNGGTVYLTTSVSTGTWYHIAWTFDGITHRLFKDGTSVSTSTTMPEIYAGTNLGIGGQSTLSNYRLDGKLEDFRVTIGKARYTENFTVPSANLELDENSEGGGLLWVKERDGTDFHILNDSERTLGKCLFTNSNSAESGNAGDLVSNLLSNGYIANNLHNGSSNTSTNGSNQIQMAFAFKKQEKFFDVVTYTGDGVAGRTVSHNLSSVPGCMIIKRLDAAQNWAVYHRGADASPETGYLRLNSGNKFVDEIGRFNDTAPTATEFTVGTSAEVNASGGSYVAYLFAHNDGDGGFGDNGDLDIIKCGSYTGTGNNTGNVVDIGFEPQWIMIKNTDDADTDWHIFESMVGFGAKDGKSQAIRPQYTAISLATSDIAPDQDGIRRFTGLGAFNDTNKNYIYVAIRKGPTGAVEDASEVFDVVSYTGNNTDGLEIKTALNRIDLAWIHPDAAYGTVNVDRLMSATRNSSDFWWLRWHETASKINDADGFMGWTQHGFKVGNDTVPYLNTSGIAYQSYVFKQARGFFDLIEYGGATTKQTINHNLGVAPEFMIIKSHKSTNGWFTWHKDLDATSPEDYKITITSTGSGREADTNTLDSTYPTATSFKVGIDNQTNNSAARYMAYLWASVDGVCKIGSYTGTGAEQTIDCGFSNGARFVMVKRADTTNGDWVAQDTVLGITSGSDDRVLMNENATFSAASSIAPDNSGFKVVGTQGAVNADTIPYIFMAIA